MTIHYFNHSPAFLARRSIVTLLYKEYGIVARFSDSTEYLEGVLALADEDRAQALAHANEENAVLFADLVEQAAEEPVGDPVEVTSEEILEVLEVFGEASLESVPEPAWAESKRVWEEKRAKMRAATAEIMDEEESRVAS